MQKHVSNSLKIIGITVVAITLFFGGCKLLIKDIFNRKDCERFNIDNIEVRTGIDVPSVSESDCQCIGDTKTASFIIDNTKVDLHEYVSKHDFVKDDSLYIKSNKSEHTDWNASVNMETAELRFILHYLK